MEAFAVKERSLGNYNLPLLSQLGDFYFADMDAHILQPGKHIITVLITAVDWVVALSPSLLLRVFVSSTYELLESEPVL